MRNTLILLILISIGLTSPALAKNHDQERSYNSGKNRVEKHDKSDHRRFDKGNQNHRNYAKHDRGDKYGHFQKKMKKLRKELRHERRYNRRHLRKDVRHSRKIARYYDNHQHRSAPVVVAPRRHLGSILSPSLVLRIPLNW